MQKRSTVVGVVTLALFGLTSCANPVAEGGTGQGVSVDTSQVETVPEIAEMLPQDLQDQGHFTVGATSTNLPAQYTDENGELVGAQIDLLKAAAPVLGVDVRFEVVTFDALQPGIESGRYETATMGDLASRQETMDFIDTYKNGAGLIAHKDYEKDEVDFGSELCGVSVAVTKGTGAEKELGSISEDCVKDGKEAVQLSSYTDNAGVVLAVSSQQNAVGSLESVVALGNVAKDPDTLKLVYSNERFVSGLGVTKDNAEFRDALRAALEHLVETGVYEDIYSAYGIEELMMPELPLNQGE